MAGLGLDAADGEHEAARRIAPVGPQRQGMGNIERRDQLARRADTHALTDARPAQGVVNEGQALDHRRADMIGEFQGGRTGAALGPIDDDEVGDDAGFQHGLDHAHEFAPMADTQLEPHRLAAGQIAQCP